MELPADQFSFVAIDEPNVLLWSLKPAEENPPHQLVACLWNLGTAPCSFRMQINGVEIGKAVRLSHIETPIGDANWDQQSIASPINQPQLATFGIIFVARDGLSPAKELKKATLEAYGVQLRWGVPLTIWG